MARSKETQRKRRTDKLGQHGYQQLETRYLLAAVSLWELNAGSGTIATDSVGSNNGVLVNDPAWINGLSDGALSFDGVDDYVEIPHSSSQNFQNKFSIEVWVKFDTTDNSYDAIAWKSDQNSTYGRDYGLVRNRYGDQSQNWMGKLDFIVETDQQYSELTSPELPNPNQWYHIVGTYDGSLQNIYVDGELKNSTALSGNVLAGNGPFYIGRSHGTSDNHDGDIDLVATYDHALSPEEIQARFQQGVGISSPLNADTWFAGEGSFDDISGINDGLKQNNVQFVDGIVGNAYSFDGGAAINVLKRDGALNPGANDFSIEAWVSLSQTTDETILKNYGGLERYDLAVVNGNLRFQVRDGAGSEASVFGVTQLQTNRWYHVAGVRSGSSFSVYLDGQLDGSQAVNVGSVNPATNYVRIGGSRTDAGATNDPTANEAFFHGSINELSFWRKALSPAELSEIISLGSEGKPKPNPDAWFRGESNTVDSIQRTVGLEQGDIQYVEGIEGQAFLLDGDDAFSIFKNSAVYDPGVGDFSIDAWVNLDSYPDGTVFKNYNGLNRYHLAVNNGKVNFTARDGNGIEASVNGPTVLNLGQWYRITGVRHGDNFSVYLDGTLEASQQMSVGSIIAPTDFLRVGASRTDAGAASNPVSNESFFVGKLDEVKYYSRAIISFSNPPTAIDDSYTGLEDTDLVGDVSSNDSDVDGDTLTFALGSGPSNGSVAFNPDGSFTYSPALNFNGTDSFTYTVSDGTESTTAVVNLTIDPDNDAPVAVDDSFTTLEDSDAVGNVSLNDSDVDGDTLTFALGADPSNGSVVFNPDGSFTYSPALNFNGTDSFTYTVSDGTESTTAVVNLTIDPDNDAPVAVDDSFTTLEDSDAVGNISLNDSDVDGDTLTFALGADPSNGSVVFNPDGSFTYSPALNFNGTDSFTYTVSDGSESTSATVNLTIDPDNDAPVAVDENVTTNEDTGVDIFVLANDFDVDGDTINSSVLVQATNGTVTENNDGSLHYQPNEHFFGIDSFVYAASDPQGFVDTAIVTITITPDNDAPIAQDDIGFVDAGQTVIVDLAGNDFDVEDGLDVSSIQIVTPATFGSVIVNNDGTISYTNQITSASNDSFQYQVFDVDGALSNIATVSISIETTTGSESVVELDNGTLFIRTTNDDDTVTAQIVGGQLELTITNQLGASDYSYNIGLVQDLNIRLKSGDDILDLSGIGLPAIIKAGDGNDNVLGGTGDDEIRGGAGHDIIDGGAGDDEIRGGAGDDTLAGGVGDDQIRGGKGADSIQGGGGNDVLYGNAGNDNLSGGDGSDFISGQLGNDFIDAGEGIDIVSGGKGDDLLYGGGGSDLIEGGSGNDFLIGENGNDILLAGAGSDVLVGGDGFDWLDAGSGRDILIGGRDSDLLQGRGGDDILIAGFSLFDGDINALGQIRDEWISNRSYEERVLNLSGQGSGSRENGTNFLVLTGTNSTIFDDGSTDLLFGQAGMDWFFYDSEDLDDQRLDEIFANDLGELLD